MEVLRKLEILANAAKYDVSCSSSGSNRKNNGGIGNSAANGICHSYSSDGRCISLLKVLMSNKCLYDCKYCVNRITNDFPRASFTVEEMVNLTINFYRRNYIEGLFLSSAVEKSPNYTMEKMVEVLNLLRKREKFNGYIHVKAIPGASADLIKKAGYLADRMSVNIELPSSESLKLLAPEKNIKSILEPMKLIGLGTSQNKIEQMKYKKAPMFIPGGQSTQMIVGASGESDRHILKLSEKLYENYKLKRVYYSAYMPVNEHPLLPEVARPPLLREHRLYQADWLLRFYGFNSEEILPSNNPNFNLEIDPKANWALNHIEEFPKEINKVTYDQLLKIPGIGPTSALKVVNARKFGNLNFENLKSMNIVLKRAKYFITCNGKFYGDSKMDTRWIYSKLIDEPTILKFQQLDMFYHMKD